MNLFLILNGILIVIMLLMIYSQPRNERIFLFKSWFHNFYLWASLQLALLLFIVVFVGYGDAPDYEKWIIILIQGFMLSEGNTDMFFSIKAILSHFLITTLIIFLTR